MRSRKLPQPPVLSAVELFRFEAKIDRNGGPGACHPWTASSVSRGPYGSFRVRGKTRGAHVVALELKLGRPLHPGMKALHSCPGGDNPACCNPEHLREGTQAENMADMTVRRKGPHPPVCVRKLNETAVREIRGGSLPLRTYAARYGVTPMAILFVRQRKRWRHVP